MSSYLQRLAQVFAQELSNNLSEYTFVFPNRRAGLFFRKYLGQALDRPIFSPAIMTINECFGSLSDLRIADQLSLLMRLYVLYQDLRPEAEPIEQFLHWGKMMLADFSEIDNHLVSNVEALYQAVEDVHDIDTHFFALTDAQRKAIERFWGEFHESVNHNNSPMHGNFLRTWQLLYPLYNRLTANLLQDNLAYEGLLHRHVIEHWDAIPPERFRPHYVFVGFNALTESERQLLLLLRDRGCVDFYFDYEAPWLSDPENRASLFMRDNLQLFQSRYAIPRNEDAMTPAITHISVSSTVGEAREVHHILEQLYPQNPAASPDLTRTAVVLPDEQLLIPLLDCFPASVTDINVTMGYPLRASDLYMLVAYPEKEIKDMPTDGLSMLELLRERLMTIRTKENSEALYLLCKTMDQIEKAIGQYPQLTFSAEAVLQILRMLTKDMTIPYVGEPLNGLQVMGVLETRALDFDNIIITGFNDELYPGRSHSNSFIPYILRRGFGLPTPERQNAIFAYNFYRMLSYAQHVWLITNSTADDQHSGEVSRYLYQLKWQYHIDVEHVNVTNTLSIPNKKEEDIIKTDIVMEMLRHWQKKPLSASALNKYLYCPKQFYYRYVMGIHEPPKEEDIVASGQTIGNVLHHIMQQLYAPFEKKNISSSDLRTLLDSLTEERWQSLLSDIEGDVLAMQITKSYVRNILLYDLTRTPFFYEGSECCVKRDLEVTELGTFHFVGYIDRLDKRAGTLNVIDYKTGGAELEFKDMAHVFHRNKNQDKALQTLLYCWMIRYSLPQLLADHSEIAPHIYPVRSMAKTEAIQTLVHAKGVADFTYTQEVEKEYIEGITNLLQEIFNPDIPFVATTECATRCKSCAFIRLCKG